MNTRLSCIFKLEAEQAQRNIERKAKGIYTEFELWEMKIRNKDITNGVSMTGFKVKQSGWYRTRDGGLAEVVVIPNTSAQYPVSGYVLDGYYGGIRWSQNGERTIGQALNFDLVEYLGKERPKEKVKHKVIVYLYNDGVASLNTIRVESHPFKRSPEVVETKVIEWEVPGNG